MFNTCLDCGFEIWDPIKELEVSTLGLYNDNRFMGRCILVLKNHEENFETIPEEIMNVFCKDLRKSILAIKKTTKVDKVNISFLGNRVSHFHAHLIPRYPENEEFPDCSPWNDKRINTYLSFEEMNNIKKEIFTNF